FRKCGLCRIKISGLELETAQSVERLGREDPIAEQRGDPVALLQGASRLRRVAGLMRQNRSTAECLCEDDLIALARGCNDQRVVGVLRIPGRAGALIRLCASEDRPDVHPANGLAATPPSSHHDGLAWDVAQLDSASKRKVNRATRVDRRAKPNMDYLSAKLRIG